MTKQLKEIAIPFGAKDSELCGWEYTIPEGMEATIVNNKIVVKKKDSEDERIRKFLIQMAQNGHGGNKDWWNKCVAWLEKKGEQKETLCDKCMKEQPSHSCQDITELGRCAVECEQKPANKVEPKFEIEEGKWYVCIKDLLDSYANKAFHKGDTYLSTQDGSLMPSNSNVPFEVVCPDTYFRDWTIQDAKPGDVLSFDNEDSNYHSIGIFKRIASKNEPNGNTYRCYVRYGGFEEKLETPINGDELHHCGTSAHPATKEQRDLLFQKMHEAGYEWDAKKKELKKIEQNPAWSEEDERLCQCLIKDQKKPLIMSITTNMVTLKSFQI